VAIKGDAVYQKIILAGQIAYSDAYKYVYFVSIGELRNNLVFGRYSNADVVLAFGAVSIIAAAFLGNIEQFMVCYPLSPLCE
jgi:hypothetical protein